MAFISTKEVAKKRKLIKEKYPLKDGWKFSIVCKNYSSINVSILEAPYNLLKIRNIKKGNETINPYYLESIKDERKKKDLQDIYNIINNGNYDRSDLMTDYFDVGFYTNLEIGRWDKTFVNKGNKKSELEIAINKITKENFNALLPGIDIKLTENYCLYHYIEEDIYVINKVPEWEEKIQVIWNGNEFVFEEL